MQGRAPFDKLDFFKVWKTETVGIHIQSAEVQSVSRTCKWSGGCRCRISPTESVVKRGRPVREHEDVRAVDLLLHRTVAKEHQRRTDEQISDEYRHDNYQQD